jgi:hypothetical protein
MPRPAVMSDHFIFSGGTLRTSGHNAFHERLNAAGLTLFDLCGTSITTATFSPGSAIKAQAAFEVGYLSVQISQLIFDRNHDGLAMPGLRSD